MQKLRPDPDPLNQNLHCNKTPRQSAYTLKFGKHGLKCRKLGIKLMERGPKCVRKTVLQEPGSFWGRQEKFLVPEWDSSISVRL